MDLTIVKRVPAPGRIDDFIGAVVPARARNAPASSPEADLGNVIAFEPRRRGEKSAPAVACDAAERPAPQTQATYRRWKSALLVAGSLTVHTALLAAFLREPTPHASIGLEVISVELVLGADAAAGLAPTPSKTESAASAYSPDEDKPVAEQPEIAKRQVETPKPQMVEETTDQPKPTPPSAAQPLVVETLPPPVEQPELAVDTNPVEKPVITSAIPTEPRDVREPQKPKPEPKPATQKSREKEQSARDRAAPASTPSVTSSSIGRGRSDADTNYRGLVSAHLARHKQFPADARSRGDQGTRDRQLRA